jgi:HlyD family secretion protein
VGLVAGAIVLLAGGKMAARPDLVLHQVKRGRLEMTIVERGALESGKNSDIYCRVQAGNKGSTIASQIKSLLNDGSQVYLDRPLDQVRDIFYWDHADGCYKSRRGPAANGVSVIEFQDKETGQKHLADVVVDLDSSGLEEQQKSQKIEVEKAESEMVQAQKQLVVTLSLNDTDLVKAAATLDQAIDDLMKYTGYDRDEVLKAATLARLKTEVADDVSLVGKSSTQLAEEDLTRYKAGDYLAALKDALGQIENARSDLSQQEDREAWSYRMAKKGYQTQTQAQAETSRRESYQLTLNKYSLGLDNLVKYSKRKDLKNYIRALEEAQRNLERTKVQADAKEQKDRKDSETKKKVFERQQAHYDDIVGEIKKCKIHTPQDGMVVYYVPEQARFGGGSQISIIAQGEPVREGQKLMQVPDLRHMIVNTKVHEAFIRRVHAGQKATIRVDSSGDKTLHGEVEAVASVPSQQDFMSADVKVYATRVVIDPGEITEIGGLKPGMSAEVTITIADALENVLTVPIQAIVGGSEMGATRSLVVMTPEGPKERQVTVGVSNDRIAEIKEGLEEGDEVVLNPKAVLGDKAKVHEPGAEKGSKGGKGGKGGDGGDGRGKGSGKNGPGPAATKT